MPLLSFGAKVFYLQRELLLDNVHLDPFFKNFFLEFFSGIELKGQTKDAGYHRVLFSSFFSVQLFPVSSPNALK